MKLKQQNERILNWGTSRSERYTRALLPENIRVDARELPELVAFFVGAAATIKYKGFNGQSGSWLPFFEKDPSIFFALLATDSPELVETRVLDLIRKYYLNLKEKEDKETRSEKAVQKEILLDLMKIILEIAKKLDDWYTSSLKLWLNRSQNKTSEILQKTIEALAPNLQLFDQWLRMLKAANLLDFEPDFEVQIKQLAPIWMIEEMRKQQLDPILKKDEKLPVAFEKMREIFQAFHFQLIHLHQKAIEWFNESLAKKNDHEPHVGLLLAYLHLFLHARDHLNLFPRRHLDHYYFDWLRQEVNPHLPDRCIVSFQLADQIQSVLLRKNTLLLAGVNEEGLASVYATTEDLQLSSTKVSALKNLFISKNVHQSIKSSYQLVGGIYAAPIANSKDGLGAPFESTDQGWPVFGEEQLNIPYRDRQMVDARVGFVLAAPIFSLQEGDREITLQFRFTASSMGLLVDLISDVANVSQKKVEEVISSLFSNALNVSASTDKGWFPIKRWKVDEPENWRTESAITLSLYLGNADPAIVDNNPELLGEAFDTTWPLVKIELNPDHNFYLYSFVSDLELELINITTSVEGLKSLTLINGIGLIDHSAPFFPFGPLPAHNAYLLVGSQELFKKRLTALRLDIDWYNLPDTDGGLEEYYRGYNQSIDNQSYQIQVSALSNSVFQPRDAQELESLSLFKVENNRLHTPNAYPINLKPLRIRPDYQTKSLSEYNHKTNSGYIKLQLKSPRLAFGHNLYPQLFAKAMIEQTQAQSGLLGRLTDPNKSVVFPNEPFTPQINRISLSYTAHSRLNFTPQHAEENDEFAHEKVIVLYPFGKKEVFAEARGKERNLFPVFNKNGYLHIGLEMAKPNEVLSLFFDIQQSKQIIYKDNLDLSWYYLQHNTWEPFSPNTLLEDHTKQFTTSGIIKLLLPIEIQTNNTLMPDGLFWIRVEASGNLNIVGRVLSVYTNAAALIWIDNGDPLHFDPQVPRPPIQGLVQSMPEIAAVTQASSFYGDRPAELLPELYVRVSERLRHKNRGINNWDIEHLILEKFPELRQVKCIGPAQDVQITSGNIKVVVVPKADENTLEPRLGFDQLETIEIFLREKVSPFVQLEVLNPRYEKIKISADVFLKKELVHEQGTCLKLLHEELLAFICPWLKGEAIPIGGQIDKNNLLDFLKSRPYLQSVNSFALAHIFESMEEIYDLRDTARFNTQHEFLITHTSWSVFVPVAEHNIGFITGLYQGAAPALAIESMRLGSDFIVLEDSPTNLAQPGATLIEVSDDPKKGWYLNPKRTY